MYILLFLNFLLTCCIGVFLFNQIKEREDEIEELYDLYHSYYEEILKRNNKKEKGKVIKIDKRIF